MGGRDGSEPPSKGLLSQLDELDWSADGLERWLAAGAIAMLGLLSLATQVTYLFRAESSVVETLIASAIPLLLSVLVIVASVWLPRSRFGPFLPRIAFWSIAGAVVLVAFGQLVLLSQQNLGSTVTEPLFVLGYRQTTGTAIGLTIGLYDSLSAQQKIELDRGQERTERYSQQLSVLLRILRHDLRSGVEVIHSNAQMLPNPEDKEPGMAIADIKERAKEMSDTAESSRRVQHLMRDPELTLEEVDVWNCLESAIEEAREAYPDAEVELLNPVPVTIQASKQLNQAFEELIKNALKHNDSEVPAVEVRTEVAGDNLAVRIADNGPGIPEAEVVPLQQTRETPLVHSSGLGLWLAKWIIEDSGGSLTFDRNAFGGTTVTARLPR